MKGIAFLFIVLGGAAVYLGFTQPDTVNWPAFGAMALFYGAVYGIGVWAAAKRKEPGDTDSLLLAGRGLPFGIALFTMSATWVGGGFVNGAAEYAATQGLIWVQAPWGYALSLILGGLLFARRMRRLRFRTMLDPLEQRFGKRLTGLLFLPALTGELFWTAAILTALGATFGTVLGIDLTTAILLSAAIALGYTALGGLWAVALTDLLQLAILIIGLGLIVPYALESAGGWSSAWGDYQAKFGDAASFLPTRAGLGEYYFVWWDYALLLVFGGIPWQVYFQRVLAAKTENGAVWMSVAAGFVCLLAAISPILIGISSAVTDWSATAAGPPIDPTATLPWVVAHLTPGALAVIGLGAVAAAVMSSVDSSVLSASGMAVWNVYRPLFKPDVQPSRLAPLIQRSIWIVGIAATLIAFQVSSVYALWFLCSDFVYCLLFPALVAAFFDPKANAPGALAGFLVAAFLRFGGGDVTLGLPQYLPYPTAADGSVVFPFRTLAMTGGLATIFLVSRFTQGRYPARALTKAD